MSFGQSSYQDKIRNDEIYKSHLFLKQKIGDYYFAKYLEFHDIMGYTIKGYTERLNTDLSDSNLTHLRTFYGIRIPEIKYVSSFFVEYDKLWNTRRIVDRQEIPDYILTGKPRDLLDTAEARHLLIKKDSLQENIAMGRCLYNKDFNRFVWEAYEITIPPNETNESWRENIYIIDALTGEILKAEKNVLCTPGINIGG